MDEFLIPGNSFERLYKEYEKYGSLVVAFDFDNTVYDYHKKGHTYYQVIKLLRELKAYGFYLICFTANDDCERIEEYLKSKNIPFDSINKNPPFFELKTGKVYYNALLDDRAGLIQVYTELKILLSIIKDKTNEKNRKNQANIAGISH